MFRFAMYGCAVALVGCFDPSVRTGSPCSDTEPCPSGLVCTDEKTCERTNDVMIDAAIVDDPDAPDAVIVDAPDAPPGMVCAGSLVTVCLVGIAPTDQIDLGGVLDTDTSPMCSGTANVSQPGTCTIVAGNISINNGGLRAVGSRPLVIVAFDKLQVDGPIDVASHGIELGAGADSSCGGVAVPSNQGGPGGSFGTVGGMGGANVASAMTTTDTTTLRGGCRGIAGNGNGAGGHGGGALALIATKINIKKDVNASGAGGLPGTNGANLGNGGGGGAGGMIILDGAVDLSLGASVFANGGGGGSSYGLTPTAGAEPASWNVAAAGGTTTFGQPAGNGFAGVTPATSGVHGGAPGNGSGGGGGGGVIRLIGTNTGAANISPPPT